MKVSIYFICFTVGVNIKFNGKIMKVFQMTCFQVKIAYFYIVNHLNFGRLKHLQTKMQSIIYGSLICLVTKNRVSVHN